MYGNTAYEIFSESRNRLMIELAAAANGNIRKLEQAKVYEKIAVDAAKQQLYINNSAAALGGLKLAVKRLRTNNELIPDSLPQSNECIALWGCLVWNETTGDHENFVKFNVPVEFATWISCCKTAWQNNTISILGDK